MEIVMKTKERNNVAPASKFTLWLFIVTIILLFGGLTSAYIVSRGIDKEHELWTNFQLPTIFWYNTALILVSSIFLQIGAWAGRKGDFSRMKSSLLLSLVLGIFFLVAQGLAYSLLYNEGIVFGGEFGRTRGNYLYLLSFLHAIHIVAGLIFLGVITARAYKGRYDSGEFTSLENGVTFWHFLGILWIYLFVFFTIIN
jgi:cytochrome c oxidase subunit III